MNESGKFFGLFGGIFSSVGFLLLAISIFCFVIGLFFPAVITLFIGVVFSAIGIGVLTSYFKQASKKSDILRNGQRFTGKIYGYIEDKSCTINGSYQVNIKVHYFDSEGIEREAIVPTGFIKGSGDYPIGATIDIVALGTSYSWIEGSVRFEHIDREDELMDNKPLDPNKIVTIAVSCPNCGASFTAAKGYVGTCPYCSSSINC